MLIFIILTLVSIVLSYLLAYYAFRGMNRVNWKHKYVSFFNALLFFPFVFVLVAVCFHYSYYYIPPTVEFDSTRWKEEKEIRYKMADEIVDSKILIGKTEEEVTKILGSPVEWYTEECFAYSTYDPRFTLIDHYALIVCFEGGKVKQAYVQPI